MHDGGPHAKFDKFRLKPDCVKEWSIWLMIWLSIQTTKHMYLEYYGTSRGKYL